MNNRSHIAHYNQISLHIIHPTITYRLIMRKPKIPAIYITTNKPDGTLYTGVTSDLAKRIYEHKNNIRRGFTTQYNCKMLVYYEVFETMQQAIMREKQIKKYLRAWKLNLINATNPDWRDLYNDIIW